MEKSLFLFSEYGFEGTPVRKLASEAGLRESAIYNYFKSKTGLLETVIREFGKSSTGVELLTDELIDKLDNPPVFMKLFCKSLLYKWNEDKEVRYLSLILKEQNRDLGDMKVSVNYFINETRNIWKIIFEQMVKFNSIKNLDPELTANEFIAPLFFIRLEFLSDSSARDVEAAIERANQHIDYFWTTIKP